MRKTAAAAAAAAADHDGATIITDDLTSEQILQVFENACRAYCMARQDFRDALDRTVSAGIKRLIQAKDCSTLGSLYVRGINAGLPEKEAARIFADLSEYLVDFLQIPGVIPAPRCHEILCRAKEIKKWATPDQIGETLATAEKTPFSAWRAAKKAATPPTDPAVKAKKLAMQLSKHISDHGLHQSEKWQAILEALRGLE